MANEAYVFLFAMKSKSPTAEKEHPPPNIGKKNNLRAAESFQSRQSAELQPLLVFYGNQMSKLNNWIPPKPLQRSCPRASDIHAKLKTNCLSLIGAKLPQGLEQLPISGAAK